MGFHVFFRAAMITRYETSALGVHFIAQRWSPLVNTELPLPFFVPFVSFS